MGLAIEVGAEELEEPCLAEKSIVKTGGYKANGGLPHKDFGHLITVILTYGAERAMAVTLLAA